ncbi:MAG TPA: ergothioneine biosynthesis protein EgtC [Actinoplanes sp.]|jgi:glutamine amidotransferase
MCRHLAYLGPPIPLAELLFDPPHSLCHQSWAPRDMRGGGTINADGFGVGWYPALLTNTHHPTTPALLTNTHHHSSAHPPVRYRRHTPLWSDTTLPALAATLTAGAVLAAVRSATAGMPVVETAAAPFGDGRWLFSHNGVVRGWPGSVAKLAAALPTEDLLTLEAPTDSALLWALVRNRLQAGASPADAVTGVVTEVARAAPGSRLNLLVTDGSTIVATTAGHALSVRRDDHCVLVSSEPLDDDPSWQPVPEHTLLVADATGLALTRMGDT